MKDATRRSAVERLLRIPPIPQLARTAVGRKVARSRPLAPVRRHLNERRIERGIRTVNHRSFGPALPTGTSTTALFTTDPPAATATRFIVLSEGRSGSTLLVTELNRRWPEIRSRGEVFSGHRSGGLPFDEIVRATFFPATGQPIAGCKVLNGQVDREQLAQLLGLDGMRVILLRRRSLLRRYVSEMIARRTEQWAQHHTAAAPPLEERTITIDPDHLLMRMMRSLSFWRQCDALSSAIPSIEVWYEDLSSDLDTELRRIATFLGAGDPTFEFPPKLSKQDPEPLEDLVRNLDEVLEFMEYRGLGDLALEDAPFEVHDDTRDRQPDAWPTESQYLLLRIAFGPEEDVRRNWDEWLVDSRATHSDVAVLGSRLHRRLCSTDAGHDPIVDFRHSHIESHALTLRLLDRLDRAVALLLDDGIEPMVVDATGTCIAHPDATRTMAVPDIALVVPPERFDRALGLLLDGGWGFARRPREGRPETVDEGVTRVLLARDGLHLRLARRLLEVEDRAAYDREVWTRSTEVLVRGRRVRVPDASDQLLCTLVDGIRHRPWSTVRWIADARFGVVAAGDDLDWDRLLDVARRFGIRAESDLGLDVLAQVIPGLVPEDVVERLRERVPS